MRDLDISDINDIKMVDILVRNVSPELHRELKIEAVRQGITLSEVCRLRLEASYARRAATTEIDIVKSIHESRNERDAQIETAIYGKPLPKTYPDE